MNAFQLVWCLFGVGGWGGLATLLVGATKTMDEMLQDAEDEAEAMGRTTAFQVDSSGMLADRQIEGVEEEAWAASMAEVSFSEYGPDGEVLPSLRVGATDAELMEAPSHAGMEILRRKLMAPGGMRLEVLQSQLVLC